MKAIYRGDAPPPAYAHGDKVTYAGREGVVQHRRHNGRRWSYGLLVPGLLMIIWIDE